MQKATLNQEILMNDPIDGKRNFCGNKCCETGNDGVESKYSSQAEVDEEESYLSIGFNMRKAY